MTVSSKNPEKVINYAKKAISKKTQKADCERCIYILAKIVKIPEFKYNNKEKRSLITKSINRFKKYKQRDFNTFLVAVRSELRIWKQQQSKLFYFIFPINIEYATLNRTRHLKIDGTKIRTRSLDYAKRKFEFNEPLRILRAYVGQINELNRITYFVIETHAVNQNIAFNLSNKKVELLRSLLNYDLTYNRFTTQIGRPSPLCRVEPSKFIFVFDNNKKYLARWGNVGEFRNRLVRFPVGDISNIKNNIKKFNALNQNKLKKLLIECLNIYGNALDQIEPTYAFLSFWQILEVIALKETKNLKFNQIKSRIAMIFKNPLISDVLEVIVGKRNDFVHQGIMELNLDDVNQVKVLADSCIWFLWSHLNRFEDFEGLNYFFENAPLTERQRGKKKGIINYLDSI